MVDNTMGPTRAVVEYARAEPGGVIRWREAEDEYCRHSEPARRHRRRGENNHHIWLKRIFDRHFVKVDGINGFYVLKETIPSQSEPEVDL